MAALKPCCRDCGSPSVRFTADTVLGVHRVVFVLEDDGTVGVRITEGWDKPLRKIRADALDLNLHEFAYCGSCSVEGEGYEFVTDERKLSLVCDEHDWQPHPYGDGRAFRCKVCGDTLEVADDG